MEMNQIYEFTNTVVQEVLGENAVLEENLGNVVDIGTEIFNANAFDAYTKALINHIGKVIFVNRPYAGSAPSVLIDGWEYGSILEKISSEMPTASENESWQLVDGQSYDPHIFYQPKLESISNKLEKIGVNIEEFDDSIRVWVDGPLVKTNIKTMPHPGFPTDMQPQMATLLTLAEGTSIITEGVWEQRFRYVDELRRMGADISVDGKVAVVEGTGWLQGAPVKACDLRAGAALIVAGLAASGVTEVEDIHHIERGYDNLDKKLQALGADIVKKHFPGGSVKKAI